MAKGTIAIARVVGLMFLVLAFGGCESQGMGGTSVSSPSTESTQSTPTAAHSAGGDQGVASSLVASPTSTTSTTEVPDPWGDRDCGWQLQSYSAADIDAMSSMPVLSAVMHGDVDELATLLSDGVNPDEWNGYYQLSPLVAALEAHCSEAVELLLGAGASPNALGEAVNPLSVASSHFEHDAMERLLALGADPDAEGPEGSVALQQTDLEGIDILIAAGANLDHVDAFDQTPLEVHAATSQYEAALELLDAGADPRGVARRNRRVEGTLRVEYPTDCG